VPGTLEELLTLPGVGRKTATMVLGDAFGKPALTVGTDVARRVGWTAQTNPDKIEQTSPRCCRAVSGPGHTPADLARAPRLSRPQARVRRLRGRAALPVIRRWADRRGDRRLVKARSLSCSEQAPEDYPIVRCTPG
jgi:3-methyladenine DNA glycosylase/8-oxoguanine DNA glycosylase